MLGLLAAPAVPRADSRPQPAVPPEIVDALREVRETYGADAVLLQAALLHHAIRAGAVLATGVGVSGVEVHESKRYLMYRVETGIVFNSPDVDRRRRVSRLWTDVVVPTMVRLESCNVPADGVGLDLLYTHRPYGGTAHLAETVREDAGRSEHTVFHLLRPDIDAFRLDHIDATELFSRSHPTVDGAAFTEGLGGGP